MPGINWLINRLRCMSVPEVSHRIQVASYQALEKRGVVGLKKLPSLNLDFSDNDLQPVTTIEYAERYIQRADRVCEGFIDILAKKDVEIGANPQWTKNAIGGQQAPMVYGKTLDYRNPAVLGDIKYIWVPNRHLHWVVVAQAYYLTKDTKYLDFLASQLEGWLDQNPYLKGPNWISSLELSLRLINWAFVWQLIGGQSSMLFQGESGQRLKKRWCESVYQQAHFIQGHYSRHSSANNHLIGELAGVCVAAYNWPLHEDLARWQRAAQKELEEQTQLQNYADGVNKEQSTFYQHFVLDFLLIAGLFGKRAGQPYSSEYWSTIKKLTQFLADMMTPSGWMPAIGDCDDGVVVKLDQDESFSVYRSQMATVAAECTQAQLKGNASEWDGKSHWLLGDEGLQHFEQLQALPEHRAPQNMSYPEGGYYLLGDRWGQPDEIRCVVDCGGLGYPSIAAHGHADALSFQLFAGGLPIFVDPGTYAYQSDPIWRNYFRSTRGHNTLSIGGVNQSVIGGKFMWLTHANAHCEGYSSSPEQQSFEGWHDGFMRLKSGVIHRRRITHSAEQKTFTFEDRIESSNPQQVELNFHLHPECSAKLDGRTLLVTRGGFSCELRLDEDLEVALISGQEAPILGWYSPSFANKLPSPTLHVSGLVSPNKAIKSHLVYAMSSSKQSSDRL